MRVFVWLAYFPSDRSDVVQLHDTKSRVVITNVPPDITVRDLLLYCRVDVATTKLARLHFGSHVCASKNYWVFVDLADSLCASEEEKVCCMLVRCRVHSRPRSNGSRASLSRR